MGLFSGSKSSTSNTTNNYDQRVAVQDGIGISGDGNSIATTNNTTNNITDGGIVSRGLASLDAALSGSFGTVNNTVDRALDAIEVNNATNAQGFSALLGAAESLWNRGESLIGSTQKAVADAYSVAQNDAKGTIDNRTIMILGVAALAAFVFAKRKG